VSANGFEPSKSKSQFQQEYDDLASLYDRARAVRAEQTIIPLVLKFLPSARSRALDIGCGTGQLVWHLASQFKTVVGADYSIGMLREARRLNAQTLNVKLVRMDAERLAFHSDSFDFVLAASLLHHVHPSLAVAEAKRVLRPGGRLLVIEGVRLRGGSPRTSWRKRGVDRLRLIREWLRVTQRLGARNAVLWMRRWGRHKEGERLMTMDEWNDLTRSVAGCEIGFVRTYSYLLWDRPEMG
jgi:SAM-dependent methyltransferase